MNTAPGPFTHRDRAGQPVNFAFSQRVNETRALDLFCGAGGATKGLQSAGFHVTGVDLVRSPRYCGDAFIKADALAVDLDGYGFIWASPPCQRYSVSTVALRNTGVRYADLVAPMRERLRASGVPYAMENVPGAPLLAPTMLCGTMFGLALLRHRLFETSFPIDELVHPCRHTGDEIPVYGHGTPSWGRGRYDRNFTVADKRIAMGIDWMTRDELSQAIPPAYSEFIGRAALRAMQEAA